MLTLPCASYFEPRNDYDLLWLGLGGYEKITEENLVFCLDDNWLQYLQDQGMPDPAEAMRHIGEWLDLPSATAFVPESGGRTPL